MSNSLERGLTALELLADRGSIGLTDLATELGVSRATAFRILAALQNHGYVEHLRADHSYRLGPAVPALVARSDTSSVIDLAASAMAGLRAATSETVNLALCRRGRLVYVSILDGAYQLRMSATVGEEVPLHATALGKAILASMPPQQRDTFLATAPYPAFTEHTITRREDLEAELTTTAARGYALDEGETEIGAACVAAAIQGRGGFPVGALSVAALGARLPVRERSVLGREVLRWCRQISAELGFVPPDEAGGPAEDQGGERAGAALPASRRKR